MKTWILGFLKNAGKKLLILCGIAAVIAVVLFLATRPVISESILETVRREDGVFTLDGFRAGTTREDVIAWMDARRYAWSEGQKIEHAEGTYYDELFQDLDGVTWISLSHTTRVKELGRVTVRRSYYFRDGLLTHVDLETDVSRRAMPRRLTRLEPLLSALTDAFGAPAADDNLHRLESEYGRARIAWEGAADSGVDVIARRWAVRDRPSDRLKDIETVPHTDWSSIMIRVRLQAAE